MNARGFARTYSSRRRASIAARVAILAVTCTAGAAPASLFAEPPAAAAAHAPAPAPLVAAAATLGEVVGRVLVKTETSRRQTTAAEGRALASGEALITGPKARVEVFTADGGRWRVGALAVWRAEADGALLFAGSALALVPPDCEWRVSSMGADAWIGPGAWMLTAVQNEGLKVLRLDEAADLRTERRAPRAAPAPTPVTATATVTTEGEAPVSGAAAAEAADALQPATLTLRPGELTFVRPGARGFGPIVTVFLAETLATSRLVRGFREPMPELARLELVATAQQDRLQGVSNALVAGARDESGFQIRVPKPASATPPEPPP